MTQTGPEENYDDVPKYLHDANTVIDTTGDIELKKAHVQKQMQGLLESPEKFLN